MERFSLSRLTMSNYWRYLFLCCLISSVFANDSKEESTSVIVWVLLVILFVMILPIGVGVVFLAINVNTRLKKIEYKLARRGSISSGHYHLKDTNSSIRSRSNSRYENNPIKKRSRSPRNSPQPEQQHQQSDQYHSTHDDQYYVSSLNSAYSNLRTPSQYQQQQQKQCQPFQQQSFQQTQPPVSDAGVSHPNEGLYEMLPADDIDTTQAPPSSQGTVQEQQANSIYDDTQNAVDVKSDEPIIEPSYTTYLNSPQIVTETATDNSSQEIVEREYSEVPTPPTPNKNERPKVVKKGKRPQSSDKYTDPTPNGVAQMKKMKSSSLKQSPNSSPTGEKQRRASESARPGFEDWSIKSTGAMTHSPLDESNV